MGHILFLIFLLLGFFFNIILALRQRSLHDYFTKYLKFKFKGEDKILFLCGEYSFFISFLLFYLYFKNITFLP